MRALRAAWLAALMPALFAQTTSVHDLLAAARQRIETADLRASGQFVRVQENGVRISDPVTIRAHWFHGVLRVRVDIGTLSKSVNHSDSGFQMPVHLLLEMPTNGQDAIWIAHAGDKSPASLPFDKWSDGPLGPGFSYEDFLEQQDFWPGQTSEGQEKFGARDCEVVKSTPGPSDKTHYASVKTWFDPSIAFPVYVEKTVKATDAVKEFTYYGIRHEEGVWSAHQIEVKTRGQSDSTLLIIDRGSTKAKLTIGDFSPAQLAHF
jgi:hypothetical protein